MTLAQTPVCATKKVEHCIPFEAWALVPLVPLGLAALLVQQVALHQIRSVYNRDLEESMRDHPQRSEERNGAVPPGAAIAPGLGLVNKQLFDYPKTFKTSPLLLLFLLSVVTQVALFVLNGATAVVAYTKTQGWAARGEVTGMYLFGFAAVTLAGLYAALAPGDVWDRAVGASGIEVRRTV